MKVFIIATLLILVGCTDTYQPQAFTFNQKVRVKEGFYKGLEGRVIEKGVYNECFTLPFHGACYKNSYRVYMFDNTIKDNLLFKQDELEAIQ